MTTDSLLLEDPTPLDPTPPPALIQARRIEFPFSEAPRSTPVVFDGADCWKRAQSWLTHVPRPALGYYKTDFIVEYEDDVTYSGWYDIGCDAPTLAEHIIQVCRYHGDTQNFLGRYQVGGVA